MRGQHSGGHIGDVWTRGGPFIGPEGKPHGRVTVQDGTGNVLHATTSSPDYGIPYTVARVRALYARYGFITDDQIAVAVVHPPPTETATQRIQRNVDELNNHLRDWTGLETSIRALPGAATPTTTGAGTYTARGLPLRWFQDAANSQTETELPNVKTIEITRSVDTDAATLALTMYNQKMGSTGEGKTGYYTPTRGDTLDSSARWGFTTNEWHNRLTPNTILRTYQGYGGNSKTIDDARADGNLVLTGIWFIDTVSVSTDGMLTIAARDPMKLMLEQQLYPPLIPHTQYPLKYYRYKYFNEAIHAAARNQDGIEYEPIILGADSAFTGQGYLTTDGGNDVDAFGDALIFDRSGGTIPNPDSAATAVRSTQADNGYYILNGAGQISCYGLAEFYGDPFSDGYIAANGLNGVCIDMAVTHTGAGYWVLDTFGHTFAFGDATVFGEQVQIFTTGNNSYTSIEAHPSQMAYWVLDRAGNVLPWGGAVNYGSKAITDWTPPLSPGLNDAVCLRTTTAGDGYWILTSVGQVGAFGGAADHGQVGILTEDTDWRLKWWKLIPQDGGYLVMRGDGLINSFGTATSFGDAIPGGQSTKRTNGNYLDWADIIRDLALWSGFLLYDPNLPTPSPEDLAPIADPNSPYTETEVRYVFAYYGYTSDAAIGAATDAPTTETGAQRVTRITLELNTGVRNWAQLNASLNTLPASITPQPSVFGNIENTGSFSPEPLPDNMFDKRPVIDAVHQIKETVGYQVWCDDEGAFRFESPNWWAPGNFDEFGTHLGLIPNVDERVQLTDYKVTVDDNSLRSMIIISSEDPDLGGDTTITTRLVPTDALQLRGLVKPAMWTNGFFISREQQRIMAELIALHLHFQSRLGDVTCAANPLLGINDQVRIIERQSNESFIHYIRGVTTTMDLDTGSYTMNLTTNWLGTSDGWGVGATGQPLASWGFRLSERVSNWSQGLSSNPTRRPAVT